MEVPNLRGAEGVQIEFRIAGLQIAQHLLVPFELERRMIAALEKRLIAAEGDGFVDFFVKFLARENVAIGVARFTVKGAEIANGRADVGVIDITVDVVSAKRLGMDSTRDGVRRPAQSR